jgi:hypothetical protein
VKEKVNQVRKCGSVLENKLESHASVSQKKVSRKRIQRAVCKLQAKYRRAHWRSPKRFGVAYEE